MDKTVLQAIILALALLGFVGWLGGGRKWAFRMLLSVLLLAVLVAAGIFLYIYWTDKSAEHRAQKIHECAIAKVAHPKCDKQPQDGSNLPNGYLVCPPYILGANATPEQEESALSLAEQECREEINPQEKSLHEQLVQYRREHGIKEAVVITPDIMSSKDCAAKVRNFYPHVYDNLDDATLTKKVLAKYPNYCNVTSSPPTFIPDIKGIR
jgi:hypothetical protein